MMEEFSMSKTFIEFNGFLPNNSYYAVMLREQPMKQFPAIWSSWSNPGSDNAPDGDD